MDHHELEKMTVVKLREMAGEYEGVTGLSGMTKEQLIDLHCEHLGVEKPHRVASGIGKAQIKAEIHVLKKTRQEALEAKDAKRLKRTRRKIHRLRRKLRRAIRATV